MSGGDLDDGAPEGFRPVSRDDVSDLALLPRRFDLFVAETRQSLEMLGDKLLAPLLEIKDAVADLRSRATEAETRLSAVERVQVDHERQIAALGIAVEQLLKKKPLKKKPRRKTTTRKKARR